MSSDERTVEDELLIQYLLESLPLEEMERCDERSIADDDFACRLEAVENDLVDAYVDGRLSGETLERFRTAYLSSQARREKVIFAEALHRRSNRLRRPALRLRPSRYFPALSQPVRWAVAAVVLGILVATGYLFQQNRRLERSLAQLRAERQNSEQKSVGLEQQRTVQPTEPATTAPAPPPKLVPYVLVAQTRGASNAPVLDVPPRTEHLLIQLQLESDDFPSYQAALRDPATDRIVWRSGALKSVSTDQQKRVPVELDARVLKGQHYVLELSGVAPGGTELVASYPFQAAIH